MDEAENVVPVQDPDFAFSEIEFAPIWPAENYASPEVMRGVISEQNRKMHRIVLDYNSMVKTANLLVADAKSAFDWKAEAIKYKNEADELRQDMAELVQTFAQDLLRNEESKHALLQRPGESPDRLDFASKLLSRLPE